MSGKGHTQLLYLLVLCDERGNIVTLFNMMFRVHLCNIVLKSSPHVYAIGLNRIMMMPHKEEIDVILTHSASTKEDSAITLTRHFACCWLFFRSFVRGKANMRLAECRRRPTKINTQQAYRLSLERRVHVKIEHSFHPELKRRNDSGGPR